MADSKQTSDPEPTEGEGTDPKPSNEDGLKAFWAQLDERLDAAIERGVTKHVPKKPRTQRNDGRLTIPGIIADIMGGPFTPQSKQDQK